MSDNITIKELLDLSESIFARMSDITLEASIKEVRQAYERKVKSGEREGQVFWSQKLLIDDGTGSIVVDYIGGTIEDTIPKTALGRRIRVEDAKTDIYKGERRLARGKIEPLDKEEPSQDLGVPDPKEDERNYWDHRKDKEQRIITKSAIAKSLIETGRKWGKAAQKELDGWFEGVMDGVEIREGYEAVKDVSKPIVEASKPLQQKVIKKLQSEEPNEISQVEVPDETPKRAALRKTFHALRGQLVMMGYWIDKDEVGGVRVENDYRNWLDSEFEEPSSSYLSDEDMEKGIKIMAKWLNETIAKKKGG